MSSNYNEAYHRRLNGREHFGVPSHESSGTELNEADSLFSADSTTVDFFLNFMKKDSDATDNDPSIPLDCIKRVDLPPLSFEDEYMESGDMSAELDSVRRIDLPPISFEEGGKESDELPLCGNIQRTFETALKGVPMSNRRFLDQPSKHPKPDISMGLGKQQAKRDIISLADFIKHQQQLIVRNGDLFSYNGAFWKHHNPEKAAIFLREVLNHNGYGEFLLIQDVKRVRDLLLTDPELQHDEPLEPPEHVLNLKDCSYDLLADRFYPHDPDDLFTSCVNITSSDLLSPEPGVAFEQFAAQAGNGNPLVRTQLLELVSLTLLGTEAKAFYVMLGPSNTGKTQFGRFLEELIGRDNVASIRSIADFKDKWTTGAIVGKRLVTCLDLPNSPIPGDALATLKQLVGDDSVKAERKKKDPITIFRKPLLVFAGNHSIRIPNMADEQAFLNRMVTIPFSNPCLAGNVNGHLYRSLLEEIPYIIHEAISAYQDLIDRNFQVTRAEIPEEFQPAEGIEGAVHTQQFLTACCCEDTDNEIETRELWSAYQVYAKECGMPKQSEIAFARNLPKALRLAGITAEARKRVCNSNTRGYRGLRLVGSTDNRISF